MSINWSAFLVVLVVAYLIPGPDFAVILRQATQTRRSGSWRPSAPRQGCACTCCSRS